MWKWSQLRQTMRQRILFSGSYFVGALFLNEIYFDHMILFRKFIFCITTQFTWFTRAEFTTADSSFLVGATDCGLECKQVYKSTFRFIASSIFCTVVFSCSSEDLSTLYVFERSLLGLNYPLRGPLRHVYCHILPPSVSGASLNRLSHIKKTTTARRTPLPHDFPHR